MIPNIVLIWPKNMDDTRQFLFLIGWNLKKIFSSETKKGQMIFKLDMLVHMMYVRSSTMIHHFALIYQKYGMGNLLFLVLLKLLKSSPNDLVYSTQVQMLFVKSSTKIPHLILFRSSQTKDFRIGICCFYPKHAALRRKSKDWLARNQNNVSDWSDMFNHRLFQWASTMKIKLGVLV